MRAAVAVTLLLAACAGAASPAAPAPDGPVFVAMGDIPYNSFDDIRFDRLIEVLNRDERLAFAIHVGDIKDGASACGDRVFRERRAQFNRLHAPLVYTPGDNEWTDCHRSGGDPLERLAQLRRMFFARPESLGGRPMPLATQAAEGFPENARWQWQGAVFATLHVVGSFNNRRRDPAEFQARNAANLAWLTAAFAEARAIKAPAVVLAFQADPGFDSRPRSGSGFSELLAALAAAARDFGRPVLLIHGDSHRYIYDQPLRDATGNPVANVHRLEVPGGHGDVRVVAVGLEPASPEPFRLRMIRP